MRMYGSRSLHEHVFRAALLQYLRSYDAAPTAPPNW
jgi:hypothetical protein